MAIMDVRTERGLGVRFHARLRIIECVAVSRREPSRGLADLFSRQGILTFTFAENSMSAGSWLRTFPLVHRPHYHRLRFRYLF